MTITCFEREETETEKTKSIKPHSLTHTQHRALVAFTRTLVALISVFTNHDSCATRLCSTETHKHTRYAHRLNETYSIVNE